MEEDEIANAKKKKTGPLKSTPGFLKCLRNVYLYFKEEKEKGALNIPINSFIERTAVACGVGRKTLYNYAKKVTAALLEETWTQGKGSFSHFVPGLFDETPIILQPKQKKKKGKKKGKEDTLSGSKGKRKNKPCGCSPENNPGPSSPPYFAKKKPQSPKTAKNAMIQTDLRPVTTSETLILGGPNSESDGFTNFIINRDKVQQIQVISEDKLRESGNIIAGTWPTSVGTIKRDVDYFSKNNIWHTVYNIPTVDSQNCTGDLSGSRITSCQTQSASDQLTDL